MKDKAIFQSSKIEIYKDRLVYKKLFKSSVTLKYEEIKHMITSYAQDGDLELFNLSLYDNKWHHIKLYAFSFDVRMEILNFMHETIAIILLPKLLEKFNNGNDVDLELLIVNKNIGIIQTNNVKRDIAWKDIISCEFRFAKIGIGYVKLLFKAEGRIEVFEFQFELGNIRQHSLLLEIFELMIGKEKLIDYSDYWKNYMSIIKQSHVELGSASTNL
jgi:hypothetical protein